MREIGVRELKQSLSETLRAVGRGEQVRVTLRGRPLADIVPASAAVGDDRLRRLIAEGRVVPPARARPRRAPRSASYSSSTPPSSLSPTSCAALTRFISPPRWCCPARNSHLPRGTAAYKALRPPRVWGSFRQRPTEGRVRVSDARRAPAGESLSRQETPCYSR